MIVDHKTAPVSLDGFWWCVTGRTALSGYGKRSEGFGAKEINIGMERSCFILGTFIYRDSCLWRFEGKNMNRVGIIEKLFKRHEMAQDQDYYAHGSGLIQIPIGRLNEIPKVTQEFHEYETAMMRLAMITRR